LNQKKQRVSGNTQNQKINFFKITKAIPKQNHFGDLFDVMSRGSRIGNSVEVDLILSNRPEARVERNVMNIQASIFNNIEKGKKQC